MPPLASLALSTGLATRPLRDRGGVPSLLFVLRVGYPLPAERRAAFLWFPAPTLNEDLPHSQTSTSLKLLQALTVLGAPGGGSALFPLASLFEPRRARLGSFRYRKGQTPCVVPVRSPRGGGAR